MIRRYILLTLKVSPTEIRDIQTGFRKHKNGKGADETSEFVHK